MKRSVIIVLVVLLIVTNVAWLLLLVDRGMITDNQGSEIRRQKQTVDLLSSLFVELPRHASIDETAAAIRAKHPDLVVKRDGDRLEVGEVVLEFAGGTLSRITSM